MSDNINLGAYDFDTSALMKTLAELRQELDAQREYNNRLKKAYSEVGKEMNDLAAENVQLVKRMKSLEEQGRKNDAVYKNYEKQLKKNQEQLETFSEKEENLVKQLIEEEAAFKSISNQYKEASKILNSATQSATDYTDVTNELNTALSININSIADARANNTALLAVRNNLNLSTEEGKEALKLLNERLDENNEFIKENVSAYEKQKINIGNYTNSIKDAISGLDIFNGNIINFITLSQQAGGTSKHLISSLKQITSGILGATRASLAFIATPIGAVIAAIGLALGALVKYLQTTQEGMDKVTAVTRPLMAVMDALLGIVQDIGGYFAKAFISPKKHLQELNDYIKDKLLRELGYLGDILEGIAERDFQKIKSGFSGMKSVAKEVYKDISKYGNEVNNRLTDAYDKGVQIDKLQKEIERNEVELIRLGAETERQLKQAEIIRNDSSKSAKEREDAVKEMNRLTEQLVGKENEILDAKIKQLELQHSLNDTLVKDDKELATLQAQKMANEDRILDNQKSSLRAVNAIRKQNDSEQKKREQDAQKRAEQRYNDDIRRMKEATDLFVAQQGLRAKTLEEEYEINKRIADDAILISKYELDNKKKSREQHNIDVLNIENELARKQAEIIVENAQIALAEFQKENESFIEGKKILNDELVKLESERLAKEKSLRETIAFEQFENGLTTEREYQDELFAINSEFLKRQYDLDKSYKAQKRVDEINEIQLQFEEDIEAMRLRENSKFEIEQEIRAQQYQMQLTQLRQKLENEEITTEEFERRSSLISQKYERETAEFKTDLAKKVENAKISTAINAFNIIAEVAGKESEAGKALAIASTTMETYQGATSAYASVMKGVPAPANLALAPIAAGITIAQGLMNVKKIVSTKTPKVQGFATGGRIENGVPIFRENGDNRLITAKTGEVILNENQQRLAGGDSFFRSIGVPGFATGGRVDTNKSYADSIDAALNNNFIDFELFANAIKEGAKQGTQQGSEAGSAMGIVNLSQNREIEHLSTF